jgi:hypothetical protein
MGSWEFKLGEIVTIAVSSEHGEVIGRAEYPASPNQYLVRYRAGDGRAVESWWQEEALAK